MADGVSTTNDDAALREQAEKLEAVLSANEALRKRTRLFSVCGLVLIGLLLIVFVWRAVSHVQGEYVTPLEKDPGAFVQELVEEARVHPVLLAEAEVTAKVLGEEILPDFSSRVFSEFANRRPEFEETVLDMGERLDTHTQKHVKKRLEEALYSSLDKAFQDLYELFPEVKDVAVEEQVAKSKDDFAVRLGDSVDKRIDVVQARLDELHQAVEAVGKSRGYEELAKARQGDLEEALLDAFVDLIVYELKPEFGDQPAKQGGEK